MITRTSIVMLRELPAMTDEHGRHVWW